MNQREQGSSIIVGLVLGLVGGFVAGILMADRPGSELRRDIETNSAEWTHNLKEKIEELKEQASDKLSDFRGFTDEKFRASAQNIQSKVAEFGKQLEDLTVKQKSKV